MKKKVIVRGPALSRSGYGEHTRFLLRSLRKYEDRFDVFLLNVGWGQLSWIHETNEEREWIDYLIGKTSNYINHRGNEFDISVQVTIPNEWERMAPINIGVTAGIETSKVAPSWLEKSSVVDKIITISEHSKNVYEKTSYSGTNPAGQPVQLTCMAPVKIVRYPVREITPKKIDLDLKYDFNFLLVAQLGIRKNVENTVKWFVEEFIDQEIGLVVKTSIAKNSILDRGFTLQRFQDLLSKYENRKCSVYLLHGDMTEAEISALYKHPKIKSLVSLSHGEGFCLPIYEAAYNGLPVVAPEWSGHIDYMMMPAKDKKKKTKNKTLFKKVDFTLRPVQPEAVWDGVIQADSVWCYAEAGSFKMAIRELHKDYGRFKKQATKLQKHICEKYSEEKQFEKFANEIYGEDHLELEGWLEQLDQDAEVHA